MNLSFGIYKKQLLFFAGLFVILGGIFYFVKNQLSYASISKVSLPTETGEYNVDIDIKENGDVYIAGKKHNKILSIEKNYDELRYKVKHEEEAYISKVNIYVHLPKDVPSGIKQLAYNVHGVSDPYYYQQDAKTLFYSASNLTPQGTFTIVAQFPKDTFDFPISKKLISSIIGLSPLMWFFISISLPILAIIIFLFMFRQAISDKIRKKTKGKVSAPPDDLSPAEVEVLITGKVSPRSIAATLLDLARRNYIHIASRENSFAFGRKKNVDLSKMVGLRNYEKMLIAKIFTPEQIKSTLKDIQLRIGRHMFSRKIAEVYIDIYDGVAKRGFFIENPSRMHNRYRKIGMFFFLTGLIGFVFGIFAAPDPKFYLLFWAAMIFTSLGIIKMSPQLPIRTQSGQKEVIKWLEFKNFLTDPSPVSYEIGVQEVFIKYLPYAIVFSCETEWSNRFIEHPFRLPDWYFTNKNILVLEDFIEDIFPVIGYVSKELASAREPVV